MHGRHTLLASALLSLVAFVPAASHAAGDLAVRYAVVPAETHGSIVTGTVHVEVRNLGGAALRNVDLRLAAPGPHAIEHGLFQFGAVPAGEARTVSGGVVLDQSGPPPLWTVDYDDESGAHHQRVLPGQRVER